MPRSSPSHTDPSTADAAHIASHRQRRWHWLQRLAVALLVLLMLGVGALWAMYQYELGASSAWRVALWGLDGRLSGTVNGGTLAGGLSLRDLHYRDRKIDIAIDRIDSKWHLSGRPWHWDIDYIRMGKMNVSLEASAQSSPLTLAQDLRLPMSITLRQLTLHQLVLHQGAVDTTIADFLLNGHSDGVHHALTLQHVSTPYGDASADMHLVGTAPFVLDASMTVAAAYRQERARLDGHVSGNLSALEIAVKASGDRIDGTAQIDVAPFQPVALERLTLDLRHVNPKVFLASAPQADIDLHAALASAHASDGAFAMSGPLALSNAQPGAIDEDRLPIKSASADITVDAHRQQLAGLNMVIDHGGKISGRGELHSTGSGEFQLLADRLDLHALYGKLKPSALQGPITVKLEPKTQNLSFALSDNVVKVNADIAIRPEDVEVRQAQLIAGHSQLDVHGTLARNTSQQYTLDGKLTAFNPAAWMTGFGYQHTSASSNLAGRANSVPLTANINGDFNLQGTLVPLPVVKLAFHLHDSSYDNTPLSGNGVVNLEGRHLLPSDASVSIAGNQLVLKGSFGAPHDALHVTVDAPQLARLGFGLSGAIHLDGQLAGTWSHPDLQADYRADQLQIGGQRLQHLSGQAEIDAPIDGKASSLADLRLKAAVDATGYKGPEVEIDALKVHLAGTYGHHDFHAEANGIVRGKPLVFAIDAQGMLSEAGGDYTWRGSVSTLQNRGQPAFSLETPVAITASMQGVTLGATRIKLARSVIDLKSFSYDGGKIRSEGSADALEVGGFVDAWNEWNTEKLSFKTDLVLDARWNIALTDTASGFAQIDQRRGDVSIDNGRGMTALGLSGLHVRADLQSNRIQVGATAGATGIGDVTLQGSTQLQEQSGKLTMTPASPLSARLSLRIPQLKNVSQLLGPQVLLDGALNADLSIAGTIGQPSWSGSASGDKLALTLFEQGIHLHDGSVRIDMDQNIINLRQVEFHGGEGTIKVGGQIQIDQSNPNLRATIVADRLQLFASADQQLTLSGQAKLANRDQQLHIDGSFKVDKALFDLPQSSAPVLGSDVVVISGNGERNPAVGKSHQPGVVGKSPKESPTSSYVPYMDIHVDLGDDFRFKGQGADLLLGGAMNVQGEPSRPLRATGTISVIEGTYEAFGRKLAIEQGQINFLGPLDNANISILAMRRGLDVEPGVQISGTVLQPRVRLVSEPTVADEEKLSWLMFGHGSDSSNASQLRAADAMLALANGAGGKRIAQTLGVDQFSIGASESGLNDQQVLNVGKAISERFYLGYEQSLSGAASIVKFTWQLSRRWSIVARGGAINSMDVLFNLRYD